MDRFYMPFISHALADEILAREDEAEQQRNELEAELGSSYFMESRDPWMATTLARLEMAEREDMYSATSEGQLYKAHLEAARFMESAITPDMRVTGSQSYWLPGGTQVPEYYFDVQGLFLHGDSEDIPF